MKSPLENTKNIGPHSSKTYQERSLVLFGAKYILVACALTSVIIVLVVNSFRVSIQTFHDLDIINEQILASFSLNSRVKMVMPSFLTTILFQNDSSYKVKNKNATETFLASVDAAGDSNEDLLAAVSNGDNEIDDPVVDQLLRGKVCGYVSAVYYKNCLQVTNGESVGLLGLQPKYYNVVNLLKYWMFSANRTWESASAALTQVGLGLNNVHFVMYELYDVLSNHLIDSFVKRAEDQKNLSVKTFWINVVVTLVAMFLIRVIVLKKLRGLDIGIRRILRLIPYRVIEENKVMSFYLVKTFGKEVEILRKLIN